MELLDDNYCFACGALNPIGLKLCFTYDEEGLYAEFEGLREHQGYKGVVHGGILTTLLDEVMARLLIDKGLNILTVKLEIRFRRPVPVGSKLIVRANMDGNEGKFILTGGRILSSDGKVLVTAKGTFAEISKKE